MNKKKDISLETVAVIGAGGIGSYFCGILADLLNNGQLSSPGGAPSVTVYDFDLVEPKNLLYQDYKEYEVGMYKSAIMGLRYRFYASFKRFDEQCLGDHSFYIICADNAKVRNTIYTRHGDKGFLDMRSEGDVYAVFTHAAPADALMQSLGEEPESQQGHSCQLAEDLNTKKVQLGNRAVAVTGAQMLLHMVRGEPYPPFKTMAVC